MADITRTIVLPEEDSVSMLVRDRFDIPSEDGKRLSMYSPYHPRIVNDTEGVISEDNGALRIRPKTNPGWGTSSLAYGPFARETGLTFATILLNGHNASQSDELMQPYSTRIRHWLHGSGDMGAGRRVWQWMLNGQRRRTISQFRRWKAIDRRRQQGNVARLDENLAVGWFADTQGNPLEKGSVMVMRSAGAHNGTLCTVNNRRLVGVVPDMMNVPICLVTVLREKGAAYYAASLAGAVGLTEFPELRPIGIDTSGSAKSVYAGIDQSVLGQVGFEVSTRVHDVRIARVGSWTDWYGTAQVADSLLGKGDLAGNSAETDQNWQVRGYIERTPQGAIGHRDNFAQLHADEPNGLIHVQIDCQMGGRVALYWRIDKRGDGWRIIMSTQGTAVQCSILGSWITVGSMRGGLKPGQTHNLQIRDDGDAIGIDLDGETLFDLEDGLHASETGIGFALTAGVVLHHLEAHPRTITLPQRFGMRLPYTPKPGMMTLWDELTGNGEALENSTTVVGDQAWQKTLGKGRIMRVLGGAQVEANPQNPNPGRTLYTVNWNDVAFASLSADIVPPGTARGQNERGRGGLVFWQDKNNYIVIGTWLDDSYGGASVSSFYRLNGFEEIYDAVWTNVGNKIKWGEPYNLRCDFDGAVLVAYLNNQPVLYRALTDIYPKQEPIKIRRVGLAINWEWGDDTGSLFENFVARGADRLVEQTRVGFRTEPILNGSTTH